LVDAGLPGGFGLAAKYARTDGVQVLLGNPEVWGVGPGLDKESGTAAVALLVEPNQRDRALGSSRRSSRND
jgi:hypothetical protein